MLIFFTGTSWAQVCTGDYTIDNIDTSGDIAVLSGCTEINGYLGIGYTSLTNLNGLEKLTTVGGDLWIDRNDALTSLAGLENMTSVDGYLVIDNNTSLTNLSGLGNITTVGGNLWIERNDALTSLTGL